MITIPIHETSKSATGNSHAALEKALRNSELRYRKLFETSQDGILILNAGTGLITDVSSSLLDMLGYAREELVKMKIDEVGAFDDFETRRDPLPELEKNGPVQYKNLKLRTKTRHLVQVDFVCNAFQVNDEMILQCNIRDISERMAKEAAVQARENTRLSLVENQEAHGLLIEKLPVGVIVHAADTRVVSCNPEASQLLGVPAVQVLGKKDNDPDWNFIRPDGTRLPVDESPCNQVIATRQVLKNYIMGIDGGNSGGSKCLLVNAYPEVDNNNILRQVVVILTDISDFKNAEEKIRRHVEHLTALVEIDRAINYSFDLNLSLTTLLTHVLVQLKVDAADVLLFNPQSQMFEYVAGRGFHTKAIEQAKQALGQGYAGRAAKERCVVHIPDLAMENDTFLRKDVLATENFVGYHGVPLIAKGKVLGVLEIFHRTRLERDDEWLYFLKAMAAQAAIAIDNVSLFDNLQRSNTELFKAYDATIEGWSRALELRDDETEGHSQRVALLTVKLARLFGLNDEELVQVRWGSLLHDIGKMGISDEILQKHESLTTAEWVEMKKHTIFAYEMLSPILYLRAALDIPYAHHEKWDGSGYPLGLKGEQIPLVARIFAVVDVWAALRSDRRYRSSWSVEKVRKHIQSLAGTHFDPQVVKLCLDSNILVD
ncbi:HD domain-containing phosphohydrolase [Geopsychrobacter electrodiphilus]|uniref:HD domain-containing phosphohydrolase n=1 Tax=Geopsychrobacter electrodiphilus TaxID=225196 RepID=UPI00037A41CA|nr:HD domain-containing phosphohydrolase [Geopsychrobacter electrodiphilus]